MPAPGAPSEELLIARFRSHARRLFWSALVLIATFGATAYFYGNLPEGLENWMLLVAASLVVLVLVVVPFTVWYSRSTTITTRRVIARHGIGARRRQEMSHARGYTIAVRRGPLQRLWGSGTITLSNGVDAPLRLSEVPNVTLVHETLADQIEVGQILAHRDAQGTDSFGHA
ncbi:MULTISPECIES: PH domain-containing protein [unclassified Microbacterium]|uniref:PH domain-containing protein n=1 Tax=unclassified Microbacterium TaxID=2609290 RepID=UPI000EA90E99|nr:MULTISPECIES: PH domain-containing protein [unclassified Microbacterium]MBT2485371.1 PH domain-containing protein [Microbacterium sp. ISL-108]RKN68175.1 PH domain-containing protein [Microbacterium sp. CGR2]